MGVAVWDVDDVFLATATIQFQVCVNMLLSTQLPLRRYLLCFLRHTHSQHHHVSSSLSSWLIIAIHVAKILRWWWSYSRAALSFFCTLFTFGQFVHKVLQILTSNIWYQSIHLTENLYRHFKQCQAKSGIPLLCAPPQLYIYIPSYPTSKTQIQTFWSKDTPVLQMVCKEIVERPKFKKIKQKTSLFFAPSPHIKNKNCVRKTGL